MVEGQGLDVVPEGHCSFFLPTVGRQGSKLFSGQLVHAQAIS